MARSRDENARLYVRRENLAAARQHELGPAAWTGRHLFGPRRGRPQPAGIDVSAAGTLYEGNSARTLAALLRRAAFVAGADQPDTLTLGVTGLDLVDYGKGAPRNAGFGIVNEDEDEVTVSIENTNAERDDETGMWVTGGDAGELRLHDIERATANESGDLRAGLEDLALASKGVENIETVTRFHVVLPGYFGG